MYMELMGHIKETDIQWVMEWWHILSMVYHCCKDYYVPLVGLRFCSYYSPFRIWRKFWERQGAPSGEGAFHTEVFTNRILGGLCEAWSHRRVTKGIVPPRYIYPTVRYKQWLEDDMKWILRDEKAYMKTSKKARRVEWPPWYAPYFTFLHFIILMFLFLNLIKNWSVPNPLWKQSYYLLIWAIRESIFIIFAYRHLIPLFCFCFFCFFFSFAV